MQYVDLAHRAQSAAHGGDARARVAARALEELNARYATEISFVPAQHGGATDCFRCDVQRPALRHARAVSHMDPDAPVLPVRAMRRDTVLLGVTDAGSATDRSAADGEWVDTLEYQRPAPAVAAHGGSRPLLQR